MTTPSQRNHPMLSVLTRSLRPATCGNITTQQPLLSLRHASIKSGVARGLRASGVEPSSRRTVKRKRPRRGPNTGAIGQKKNPPTPSRRTPNTRAPIRDQDREFRPERPKSSTTSRSSSLRTSTPRASTRRESAPRPSAPIPITQHQPLQDIPPDRSSSSHPYPFPVPYTTATSVFVPGRRSIAAIIQAHRRTLHKLYISSQSRSATATRQLEALARRRKLPLDHVTQDYIDRILTTLKMPGTVNDGCLLECSELSYTPIAHLTGHDNGPGAFTYLAGGEAQPRTISRGEEGGWRAPFVLWLHEVVDTRNIAALYRSALYFGVDAVVLTERGTGRMQPAALRASAGAAEFLPTFTVMNTKAFMTRSREQGWQFLGALPPAKDKESSRKIDVNEMKRTPVEEKPSVLVLGNEDQGLSKEIKMACDLSVTIPAAGKMAAEVGVDSLNVSVAGTLLFSRLLQKPATDWTGVKRKEKLF